MSLTFFFTFLKKTPNWGYHILLRSIIFAEILYYHNKTMIKKNTLLIKEHRDS